MMSGIHPTAHCQAAAGDDDWGQLCTLTVTGR
jgi:hypothetical protein